MEIYNTEHTCTKIIWFKIDLIVWKSDIDDDIYVEKVRLK